MVVVLTENEDGAKHFVVAEEGVARRRMRKGERGHRQRGQVKSRPCMLLLSVNETGAITRPRETDLSIGQSNR